MRRFLRNNKTLTKWRELGSIKQYEKDFDKTPITKLVRIIVSLELEL